MEVSPLDVVISQGNRERVLALLESGSTEFLGEILLLSAAHNQARILHDLFVFHPAFDPNVTTSHGQTGVFLASEAGHRDVVVELLKDPRTDVNRQTELGFTPLYAACKKGQLEVVKILLEDSRVDVNCTCGPQKDSPFHVACRTGQVEVVEEMRKDASVNMNLRDRQGHTPFYTACAEGETKVVQVLKEDHRVDVTSHGWLGTPFSVACAKSNLYVIEELLWDERIDVNEGDATGLTPFALACKVNNVKVVRRLVKEWRIDINRQTGEGATPLIIAVAGGLGEIVNLLLSSGRPINTQAVMDGRTAFEISERENHPLLGSEIAGFDSPLNRKLYLQHVLNQKEVTFRSQRLSEQDCINIAAEIQQSAVIESLT